MAIENIGDLPENLFEGQDLTAEEIRDNLMGICDAFSSEEYQKKFSADEKKRFKDTLADISIELRVKESTLKEITKVHKAEMKPLVVQKNEILENLENGSVWVTEEVYRVFVHDKGVTGVYDNQGRLQKIEKLKRGLQTTMKLVPKTGTDD